MLMLDMSMLGPMSIVMLMLLYIHGVADFDVYAETDTDTHAEVDIIQAEAVVDAEANFGCSTDACTLHASFFKYSSYFLCTFVKTFSSIHFGT